MQQNNVSFFDPNNTTLIEKPQKSKGGGIENFQ